LFCGGKTIQNGGSKQKISDEKTFDTCCLEEELKEGSRSTRKTFGLFGRYFKKERQKVNTICSCKTSGAGCSKLGEFGTRLT
jgi:hypothetical protein